MTSVNKRTLTKLTSSLKNSSISSENAVPKSNYSYTKRKADNSPSNKSSTKRIFWDLTNDGKTAKLKSLPKIPEKVPTLTEKLKENQQKNAVSKPITRAQVKRVVNGKSTIKPDKRALEKSTLKSEKLIPPLSKKNETSKPVTRATLSRVTTGVRLPRRQPVVYPDEKVPTSAKDIPKHEPVVCLPGSKNTTEISELLPVPAPTLRRSTRLSATSQSLSADKSASLYESALEDISSTSIKGQEKDANSEKSVWYELSEFDKELLHDPQQVSLYAMEIFQYLRSRESHFPVSDYMSRQSVITRRMRAMLVDWMVEVQENFELNHETLYLSVKIVDLYLDKVKISKDKLQLVGAAALFLSCKYDERLSPLLEDFIYVCDGAYTQDDLLIMEQSLLKHMNYELSMPISYSFLRRYARCARIQMPLLTLARYILELSLMDYSTVTLSDSKQAAAALYLAFRMVKHDTWNDTLVFYTGYKLSDFKDIVFLFNAILHKEPNENLMTIRNKYSHQLFFHVAKTPLISDEELKEDMELLS